MVIPNIINSNTSIRVQGLKELFLSRSPQMCSERAVVYTEVYRSMEASPRVLTRAVALRETLARMPIFIDPGEVIMGHPASKPRGVEVFPEAGIEFIHTLDSGKTKQSNRIFISPETCGALRALAPYWRGKTLADAFSALRPPSIKAAVEAGLIYGPHAWSGFAQVSPDYDKLLRVGILGIREELEQRLKDLPVTDPQHAEKVTLYHACLEVCQGLATLARRHQKLVLDLTAREDDPDRLAELDTMAALLERIPLHPARNFREAVQAFWFMHLAAHIESNGSAITPGRFDQYMWPFLKRDLTEGAISPEAAQELIDMLFLKFCEIIRLGEDGAAEAHAGYAAGQNLTVGGLGNDGEDATNPLSHMCLQANSHIGLTQPNVTARLHRLTPENFLESIVQSLCCGNGMPQVVNDERVVPALERYGIPLSEARDYIPAGGSVVTVGSHWGRCHGGCLNIAKVLEVTLGDGRDILFGSPLGLHAPVEGCERFECFLRIFDRQMEYAASLQLCDANLADHIHQQIMPLPFLSLFIGGCLEKGREATAGGARYNTTGLLGVGLPNCADSLEAVRTFVFEEKRLTFAEFRDILAQNFRGNKMLRQRALTSLPKFGNGIESVDLLAARVADRYFDIVEKHGNYRNGRFWPALCSEGTHIGLGAKTAASPDGRLAGFPLADGLSPKHDANDKGYAGVAASLGRISLDRALNGVFVSQRLPEKMIATAQGRDKLVRLLCEFVEKGCFHQQFVFADDETVSQTQRPPHEYRHRAAGAAGHDAFFY
ncbi:putative Formate acetyltransferase 2 [uncultured delta proteobacterium]|uniref:Putative Formate acetyltransferase 2 n=1 Tax=uncultured delta proteobacterium TaxID=34034 RepID=A0A212K740_9DELT|nr:putative Formate acetyltransferase 2 [uncultured delta proteobacterium]